MEFHVVNWVYFCVFITFQLLYEEVLSHSSPLETIATKGSNMAEHYTTKQEVQQLQCRYNALKEKAKVLTKQNKSLFLFSSEGIWIIYWTCCFININNIPTNDLVQSLSFKKLKPVVMELFLQISTIAVIEQM